MSTETATRTPTAKPSTRGQSGTFASRIWLNLANIPVRDYRFWIIQLLIVLINLGHLILEEAQVLGGDWALDLLAISVLLIPVVYSALVFGLGGAIPTAVWALVLSLPEISSHNWTTRIGILIQFGIIIAIGIIVGIRVDREAAATRAADQANLRLSRLNATAAAVAASLDLEHVLRGTLRATLNSRKQQVVWIRTLAMPHTSGLTIIDASLGEPPVELDRAQEGLTLAACLTGMQQRDGAEGTDAHTVVVALKSGERTFGAMGLTQTEDVILRDECNVLDAVANQLSVALNNIFDHASTHEALSELAEAKRNLETYIALATDAQEAERKRLSRELHDDVLQSLAVAKAQIDAVGPSGASEETRGRLLGVQEILATTIGSVRRYSKDLRPSLLDDLGLIDAVSWLVSELKSRTALSVDMVVTGPRQRLSERDELLIFRVVQEALRNVERHADATHVQVGLDFGSDKLMVEVEDNGKGMRLNGESAKRSWEAGLGLRGMDERTKLLKGMLVTKSGPGAGTRIALTVALPQGD
jgi:signal transduction histidine kinase